jgi:hypothetical protein
MHSEALYALRPTAVQRHFADASRALLISGSALVDAAVAAAVNTLAVEVERLEVLPGVLRACEDLDAALTVVSGAFWENESPQRAALATSTAVVRAAEAARLASPLVLATVVDAALLELPLLRSEEILLDVIDAGFTSFQFPMPQGRDELRTTLALMERVAEHGLGLELIDLPAGGGARALELFTRCARSPCALAEIGAEQTQLVLDGAAVPLAQAHRRLLPGSVLLRVIARALEVDEDEALFSPIDTVARDRIEAVSYAEVRLALRRHALLGSGSSCLAALTWTE